MSHFIMLSLLLFLSPVSQALISTNQIRVELARSSKIQGAFKNKLQSQSKFLVSATNDHFILDFYIGTPPIKVSAMLDTGGDLMWLHCQPCIKCSKSSIIFNPERSSSFSKVPCTSALCRADHGYNCTNGSCSYFYGFLGTEKLAFEVGTINAFGFGCSTYDRYVSNDEVGIFGFGRGPLSIMSQIPGKNLFSYCLTPIGSTKKNTLFIGGDEEETTTKNATPLIINPTYPSFYYLKLEGIRVGEVDLPINTTSFEIQKDGSGGLIIDSGIRFTYLENKTFNILKAELIRQIEFPIIESSLELCFNLSSIDKLPKLIFHFQEGADLELPPRKYMLDVYKGLSCLAMASSSFGFSVLGNFQQQDVLVVYDLGREALAFLPTLC